MLKKIGLLADLTHVKSQNAKLKSIFKTSWLVALYLLISQIGCTINTKITDLNSGSDSTPSTAPKNVTQISFDQGSEISMLAGDQIKLSVTGAQGLINYSDSGSGFFLNLISSYAPSFGTNLSSDYVQAVDSATSASAKIKINIQKMGLTSDLSNRLETVRTTTRNGITSMARSPNGTLWLAQRFNYDWTVSKSTDNGTTFSVSDIAPHNEVGFRGSDPAKILVKDNNTIFVLGNDSLAAFTTRYRVRKTLDGGNTWTTADSIGDNIASNSLATGGVVALNGAILISGTQSSDSVTFNWSIRKSIDNGATWITVFLQLGTAGQMAVDPVTGYIYSIGQNANVATIIKSTDNGNSWTSVDSFTPSNGFVSFGGLDARNGTVVYTGGDYFNTLTSNSCNATSYYTGWTENRTWFTRVSTNSGTSWNTRDYLKVGGTDSQGMGAVITPSGLIVVSGVYFSYGTCQSLPILRSSSDGGVTFANIDSPSAGVGYEYMLGPLLVDGTSNLFYFGLKIHKVGSAFLAENAYRKSTNGGATWAELNPQHDYPTTSRSRSLGKDLSGNLLNTADFGTYIQPRRSLDGGLTWTDLTPPTPPGGFSTQTSVAITESVPGNLILLSVGYYTSTSSNHTLTYRSTDNGITWSVSDNFVGSGTFSYPAAMTIDPQGNIYVTGYISGAFGAIGFVRKSSDNGATWTTVDNYSFVAGVNSSYTDIISDHSQTLYALASATNAGNQVKCNIRKSSDFGVTWTTVASINATNTDTTTNANCGHLAVGPTGKLYLTLGYLQTGLNYFSILKSLDSGSTWVPILSKSSLNTFQLMKLAFVKDTVNTLFYYNDPVLGIVSETWRSRDEINWFKVDSDLSWITDLIDCKTSATTESKLCQTGYKLSNFAYIYTWFARTQLLN